MLYAPEQGSHLRHTERKETQTVTHTEEHTPSTHAEKGTSSTRRQRHTEKGTPDARREMHTEARVSIPVVHAW